ncbi:MAG: hypothetical protein HC853_07430 [Anaerolineae bacterium]|nr:hypothetical protein [Anaerolineae bacterium]
MIACLGLELAAHVEVAVYRRGQTGVVVQLVDLQILLVFGARGSQQGHAGSQDERSHHGEQSAVVRVKVKA